MLSNTVFRSPCKITVIYLKAFCEQENTWEILTAEEWPSGFFGALQAQSQVSNYALGNPYSTRTNMLNY